MFEIYDKVNLRCRNLRHADPMRRFARERSFPGTRRTGGANESDEIGADYMDKDTSQTEREGH